MVIRYPHIVTITSQGESTQDAQGNFQPATETEEYKGRYEVNSRGTGAFVKAPDGQDIVYQGILWIDRPIDVRLGQAVSVTDGERVVASGSIKQAEKGQQKTRIWL